MGRKTFHALQHYLYPRYVKDCIFFPFLILAAMLAARTRFNASAVVAIAVNLLVTVFAFLINDIEDRQDDANSPGKRFTNPFGYKIWSVVSGYWVLAVMAVIALALSYWFHGLWPAVITLSALTAGSLYSWKSLRLKNMPVIDILAHTYFFGVSTMLYFALLPHATWDVWTLVFTLAVFLFSVYSDLFNEYRDFDEDRRAGLKNSASYLGKKLTISLARASLAVAITLMAMTIGRLIIFRV